MTHLAASSRLKVPGGTRGSKTDPEACASILDQVLVGQPTPAPTAV